MAAKKSSEAHVGFREAHRLRLIVPRRADDLAMLSLDILQQSSLTDFSQDVIHLSGDTLIPDKAFRIVNPWIPGRPVQPGMGEDYLAVVFEVAVTEGFTAMINKANRWLSDQTAVNLWIGIKYNRRANRADDRSWMGVARHNFTAISGSDRPGLTYNSAEF
jgi:hypothetical protein